MKAGYSFHNGYYETRPGASVKDGRMEKISIGEIFCFELRDPKDVMVGKEFSAQFGNESLFISFMVLMPSSL